MQLKQKVSRKFLKDDSVPQKVGFGDAVLAGLASIPAGEGPTLTYAISVLTTANTRLSSTSAAAATGSHAAISDRNAAEKEWNTKFGATADDVSEWAAGEPGKIQHAGFIPTKAETTPAQRLSEPIVQSRTPGQNSAAITVKHPYNGNADAYLYIAAPPEATMERRGDTICITLAGAQQVFVHVDTHTSANLEGLAANTELQLQVGAINSAGTSDLSGPVLVTPQA